MTQATHVASTLVALHLAGSPEPRTALACLIGTLLPDVDHRRPCLFVALGAVRALWNTRYSTGRALLGRHRGATHSLLALILASLVAAALGYALRAPSVGGYFALGYGLHLALDALTPSRVPLAWPDKRRWGLGLVHTGSLGEMAFLLALVAYGSKVGGSG